MAKFRHCIFPCLNKLHTVFYFYSKPQIIICRMQTKICLGYELCYALQVKPKSRGLVDKIKFLSSSFQN